MAKTTITTNWKEAKQQAVHVGHEIGAKVIQGPGGEKVVFYSGKRMVFTTWYAAYCYCERIQKDQLQSKKPEQVPVAEFWTGPLPQNTRAKTALHMD